MKATIITNWITKETELTQEQYDALFPKKVGRWKPEGGEEYWYLAWLVDCSNFDPNHRWDQLRVDSGNCYQTEKLAQQALDGQLAIVRVNDRIDKLNDGWEMVWNTRETMHSIYYCHSQQSMSFECISCSQNPSVIHLCAPSEIAKQIIDEMESELKLIFNIT